MFSDQKLQDWAWNPLTYSSTAGGSLFALSSREFAPLPVRLRERSRLHWINFVLTLAGMAAGGYFGGTSLAASYPDASSAAYVLAYFSSGVLGGFAVFTVSSFLSVRTTLT